MSKRIWFQAVVQHLLPRRGRFSLFQFGEFMVRKFALMIALLLASGLCAGAQTQSAPPPTVGSVSAKPTDVRRDSFDIVWRTVKEKHFDPHFGGVDWDKVREKYELRLSKIKTDAELYAMLQEMIGELHQSHFAIIPPEW